jgi:Xaa-Pro aminopeptidase
MDSLGRHETEAEKILVSAGYKQAVEPLLPNADTGTASLWAPAFVAEEYVERERKIVQAMEEANIDILIDGDPANMNYATGYDGGSFYVPQFLVVIRGSTSVRKCYLVLRGMDLDGAKRTTHLPFGNCIGYEDGFVHNKKGKHAVSEVLSLLQSTGALSTDANGDAGGSIRIGLGTPDMIDIETFAHLTRSLALLAPKFGLGLGDRWGNLEDVILWEREPGGRGATVATPTIDTETRRSSGKGGEKVLSLVSAALLINWVRVVKSERELFALRVASKIADAVMRAALATVTAGALQCTTAGAALQAQARGVVLQTPDGQELVCGGDASAVWPTIATGVDATAAHLPWSRSGRYRAGTGTFLELSGVYKRYTCPIARSVFVVDPAGTGVAEQARKQQFETLHTVVVEALGAAIALCREGELASSVYAAFNGVLAKHQLPPKLSRHIHAHTHTCIHTHT